MIGPKKLLNMARKWQKLAIMSRKRVTFSTATDCVNSASCSSNTSPGIEKGHFVVYTADQRRFVIPLVYLEKDIFRELLKLAEEEYGLPRDGPITLPCDAAFMEYAISLIQRHATKDLEKALLMSVTSSRCLPLSHKQKGRANQQFLVYTF